MQKKLLSLLLIFTFILSFCGCRREERIDFSELLFRINRKDKSISVEVEDAFFSDSRWFLYVTVQYENDHLITAVQDENKKLISVKISTLNTGENGRDEAFRRFCKLAGEAFVSEKVNVDSLFEEAGLYEGQLFRDGSGFSEKGRYRVSAFYSDMGCSLIIEIT